MADSHGRIKAITKASLGITNSKAEEFSSGRTEGFMKGIGKKI